MKTNTKITLVGAGPGDIELITVKGLNAIKNADVILYDALVNEELLAYAPVAQKIFVGKRKGSKAYSQEEINKLLVEQAQEFGHVVRLKGGDSFVFGRGSEELIYAEQYGIPVEIIPGISSAISVPALAGIPVTHRGLSNSFHVVTGTLADGQLNPELELVSQNTGTIVILMGLSKLKEIVAIYQEQRKFKTKIAIVSNGSLPEQQTLVGEIDNINALYETQSVPAPAVIVIGEVVGLLQDKKQQEQILNAFYN